MGDVAHGRPQILVVDDDGEICELMREGLGDRGYDAVCVAADHEAYSALGGADDFAALIVDVHLGAGTTGYDVARFARRARPGIPVLYISGKSPLASFETFGVTGSMFLAKPFAPGALAAHLDALIDLSRGASAGEPPQDRQKQV